MIISHRNKFAFFAVSKTGSKCAGTILRMSGAFDHTDICGPVPFAATRSVKIAFPAYNFDVDETLWAAHLHATPEIAISKGYITMEQLREYNCFAFFRDVEDRHYAVQLAKRKRDSTGGLTLPMHMQHSYFDVRGERPVTPLDFRDFRGSLKTLLKAAGGHQFDGCLPHMTRVDRRDKYGLYEFKRGDYGPDIQYQHSLGWDWD